MLQSRNCAPDAADTTGCPVCGQPVSCGARDGAAQCWCFDAPHLPAHARLDTGRCLCPACLRAALAEAGAGGG
ncbi:cysteine-rich CWC family protein [Pandoraea terrae]|nr:cysteine-rich CWC family protein [Pandoraea terrae]